MHIPPNEKQEYYTYATTYLFRPSVFLMHRLLRDRVEGVDDVEFPRRERHAVQLLEGQDVLRHDRARPVHRHRSTNAPKCIPQRAPEPRPLDVQPRIALACILGDTLQVRAQRGAVTEPRRQLVLGAAAPRQAFAESAIKSSVLLMPARTCVRSHCLVGSVSSARTFAALHSTSWPPRATFQPRTEATR